jgi:steroid delta-isomerase-like uncharacterized protein
MGTPTDETEASARNPLLEGLPGELREFGERWLAAWASRAPERITSLCTEDVAWEDPALTAPLRGRAAVNEFLADTFRAFPDLAFTLTDEPCLSPDGRRVAVPWRVSGTMLGPLTPPGLAPTRRRFQLEGVDLYQLRDGLVARMTTRYDVLEWLRQIGAVPARDSAAERALLGVQRLSAGLLSRLSPS